MNDTNTLLSPSKWPSGTRREKLFFANISSGIVYHKLHLATRALVYSSSHATSSMVNGLSNARHFVDSVFPLSTY